MLAIVIGLVIGILLPVQTSANSRLRSILGSPFVASFLSFAVGLTFLSITLLLTGQSFGIDSSLFRTEPLWIW